MHADQNNMAKTLYILIIIRGPRHYAEQNEEVTTLCSDQDDEAKILSLLIWMKRPGHSIVT